ncbi:MAG: cyclophilin-like fold protein [Candidatus Eisenbacteria bacterium]
MRSVRIKIGEITLEAELGQSKTAQLVWAALPFAGNAQMWGDEIYFRVPVAAELENPRRVVEIGDIGYWPTGNAFCIFYGKTPASSGDDIVPASPVDVIGRVTSDVSVLKGITDPGRVTVEKGM